MTSQHQPEEMEINCSQISTHVLESEGEPGELNKVNVPDEDIYKAPKKVHKFYFVKFRPYQEKSAASEIEKAEELIRELNSDQLRITKELEEIKSFRRWASCEIGSLERSDIWLGDTLSWKRCKQKRLQLSLDRLCFANKAYQSETTEPCLLSEDENLLHNHKLQFHMLHGSNKSLAKEKQLIRDVKASKRREHETHDLICTALSLEEIDSRAYYWRIETKADDQEIKRPELDVEKCISNAAVKGELWNSLGSKQSILNQLKVTGDEIDMLMKKQLEFRAKSGLIEKKLKRALRVKDYLEKQSMDINHRKKEASESILKLRKKYSEENRSYYQTPILDKAVALAKRKDVAALEKLSHSEVEKFMSKWNKSKIFRDDYEKRVLPSLKESPRLSRDGSVRGPCEEPVVLVSSTPRMAKREASFTNKELKCLIKDLKAEFPWQFAYLDHRLHLNVCSK